MTKKLTKRDIKTLQKSIGTAWSLHQDGNALVRTFTFAQFFEAFMFVTRIGIHAEVMRQYPHIVIDAGTVIITIQDRNTETLMSGNFELAKKIDVVFALSTATTRERITR